MRKKGGGSSENTYSPAEMPKEDAAKRTGLADGGSEYPKLRESAELAIADCNETNKEND